MRVCVRECERENERERERKKGLLTIVMKREEATPVSRKASAILR